MLEIPLGAAYPGPMRSRSSVNPFEYTDYRKFLRDWYQSAKQSGRLSYRSFAQRAGLKSINFFKFVMDGTRNLTEDSIRKFATGLKLNKQEAEFFRNLVLYNQATAVDEKNGHYAALMRSRKFSRLKPIEKNQYEYYSDWFHPVVREMVASESWDGTAGWIARRVHPSITTSQAERSIALLERLGFIEKAADGKWRQAETLISTGAELQSHVVHQYHKMLLDLAKQVMDELPPARRDVSTMTLGVKRERVAEIKNRIQEFRRDILKIVSEDTEPQEVVQLNIQMFPLTQEGDLQ